MPEACRLAPLSEHPLISVVVPSYNQGAFIRETITSCLAQDYRPIEVLIMDGASTDGTVEILHQYDRVPEVRWVSEPDSGVVEAVNKGLDRATGEIGAIQSSDDLYLPGAFRLAVQNLRDHPRCGLVYGDIEKIDAAGASLSRKVLPPFSLEGLLSKATWIPQPSCFFRMAAARAVNGWRDAAPYAADADMWLRMLLIAEGWKFDAFVAQRRMHADQRDVRGDVILHDYEQMVNNLFSVYGAPVCLRAAADAGVARMKQRYGHGDPALTRYAAERFPPLLRLEAPPPGVAAPGILRRALRRLGRGRWTR